MYNILQGIEIIQQKIGGFLPKCFLQRQNVHKTPRMSRPLRRQIGTINENK